MAISDFDLVFFGGSGDLAMRKLLPAMYARDVANDLPATARIICVGREDMSQEGFLQMVETNSKPNIKESVDEAAWQKFLAPYHLGRRRCRQPEKLRRPGRSPAQG